MLPAICRASLRLANRCSLRHSSFLQVSFGTVLRATDPEVFEMKRARGETIGRRNNRLSRRDCSRRWAWDRGRRLGLSLPLQDDPRRFGAQACQSGRRNFAAVDQIHLRQTGILLKFRPGSGCLRADHPVYRPRFHAETEQHELDFPDQRGRHPDIFGLADRVGSTPGGGPQLHRQRRDSQ